MRNSVVSYSAQWIEMYLAQSHWSVSEHQHKTKNIAWQGCEVNVWMSKIFNSSASTCWVGLWESTEPGCSCDLNWDWLRLSLCPLSPSALSVFCVSAGRRWGGQAKTSCKTGVSEGHQGFKSPQQSGDRREDKTCWGETQGTALFKRVRVCPSFFSNRGVIGSAGA